MNEKQRELATNRLLEIIRSGRATPTRTAPSSEPPAPPPPHMQAALDEDLMEVKAPEPAEPVAAPSAAPPVEPQESRVLGAPRHEEPEVEADFADVLKSPWVRKVKKLLKGGGRTGRAPKRVGPTEAWTGEQPAETVSGRRRRPKRRGKGRQVTAVDIGAATVKVVEVLVQDTQATVTRVAVRSIPPAVRRNQSALNMFLANTVRELLPPKRTERTNLHIVLSDQAMQIRTVGLPVVAAKERVNAIKFQLKKDLPFPLEVCEVAYRGWNPKVKDRQEVEVLAVDRRSLATRAELFTSAGLHPIHATSFPAASPALVEHYRGLEPGRGAVAIADIGASKTTITIADKGKVAFCRTISTGGDDFTSVLQGLGLGADGEDLNEVQAENYKKELGLPPEGDTATMRVAILMRPVSERISAELARSLELYRRNTMGGDVQKLLLVGGGAGMKRLPQYLSRNLGVEVEVGNPLALVELAEDLDEDSRRATEEYAPALLPVLGVALDVSRRQNVLPADLAGYHRLKVVKRAALPIAAVLLLALTGLYVAELRALEAAEARAKGLKAQIAQLPAVRARFVAAKAEYDRLAAELAERHRDLGAIAVEDPGLLKRLRVLSHIIPDNIYLEKLRTLYVPEPEPAEAPSSPEGEKGKVPAVSPSVPKILAGMRTPDGGMAIVKKSVYGRVLELTGDVYPIGSLTDVQLVDFVFALEKCGYFREVAVDSTHTLESGKVFFVIRCGI